MGTAYQFAPNANDPDGDALTFSVDNRPSWSSFDAATGRITGTPTLGDVGLYSNIVVKVSDGQVESSLPAFSINVAATPPTNSPPVISGTPATQAIVGSAYQFVPTATDPDGDTLTFSIANRPAWSAFNNTTGELSGTPSIGDTGNYSNIRISVSDGTETALLPAFAIDVIQSSNGTAELTWTAPTQNEDGTTLTDLAGFKIYYGTASGNYTSEITIDNPSVTTYLVENLAPNTYYFVATAVDSGGEESRYSGEYVTTVN